jgi:hypothetical protein
VLVQRARQVTVFGLNVCDQGTPLTPSSLVEFCLSVFELQREISVRVDTALLAQAGTHKHTFKCKQTLCQPHIKEWVQLGPQGPHTQMRPVTR